MSKKTKPKIQSYTLLPNGIWITTNKKHIISWEEDGKCLVMDFDHHPNPVSNTPFLRAYYYLFDQLIGRYQIYYQLKQQIPKSAPSDKKYSLFKNISITKILISMILIKYLIDLQYLMQVIFYQEYSLELATFLSITTEYAILFFFVYLVLWIFLPSKIISKISKYNFAFKSKTKHARNNTVFTIVSVLLSLYLTKLASALILDTNYMLFIVYPIVYEMLTLSEKNLNSYFSFILYSPVYQADQVFTQKSTKKEQKCITSALR